MLRDEKKRGEGIHKKLNGKRENKNKNEKRK